MSYYRKYRPQKFMDLIGQDHVQKTLTNALQTNNFSHAYLFSGPKGSGKTSTARLLAKALNCSGRQLGKDSFEPCDKCLSCKEVMTGANLDMVEIDAASNRGIDEMRELRDKIRFAPTAGRFKIYIIDECHMLTKEAFNALLKTLEEPPAHAIFILATTEMHKVPPTILSRTQSFEFKKATIEEILQLLNSITKKENLRIEEKALNLIARLSFGAYRDALSMLDQVGSLQVDDKHIISLTEVQAVLGQTAEGLSWEFAELLAAGKRSESIALVGKIYFEGKDLENFIAQVITIFRKVMLIKAGLNLEFEASFEELDQLKAMANNLSLDKIILIIEKLSEVSGKLRSSILGQLPLEMAVFELTDEVESKKSKVESQIEEKKAEKIEPVVSAEKIESPVIEMKVPETESNSHSERPEGVEESLNSEIPRQARNDKITTFDKWPEVIAEVKSQNNTLAALLGGTVIQKVLPNEIDLAARFKFHADQICNKKNLVIIEAAVLKVAGTPYKVDCVVDKDLEIQKPLEAEEVVFDAAKEVFDL